MAYGNSGTQNRNSNAQRGSVPTQRAAVAGTMTQKKESVFRTGLFKPKFDDAKNVAEVLVKEAITIPAGSRIKLYMVDEDKQGTSGKLFNIDIK
jgi:PAB1-binding protein PBP1